MAGFGRYRHWALGALASLLAAGSLAAQSVAVRVVDDEGGRPVLGALLTLLAPDGRPVARALTDQAGRATLRAPAAGSFRLKADRIGYQGLVTEAFAVAASGVTPLAVTMPGARVLLPELTVKSTKRVCQLDRENGSALAAVWSEAEKALAGTQVTGQTQPPELEILTFERRFDRRDRVVEERSSTRRARAAKPFATADPSRLIERGFIEERDGDTWYSAPDAELLLSSEFLELHCFWVVRGDGDRADLIGLAFEPARGRRVPEVKGTLWLDRATSELRYLEFGYVNLQRRLATGKEGGRIEFTRLPNGSWIVSDWTIRVPVVATLTGRDFAGQPIRSDTLLGMQETGGRAELAGPAGASDTRSVVTGVVWDSVAGGPLEGAVVALGGAYADTTGADGRYRIETPTRGNFVIRATHPRITALAFGPVTGAARLDRGRIATADLAIPPLDRFAGPLCDGVTIDSSQRGILVGVLRDQAGTAMPGGSVDLRWTAERSQTITVTADTAGAFRVCGLDPDRKLWVRAASPLVASPSVIALAGERLTTAELTLGARDAIQAGVVRIEVRSETGGTPIADAIVVAEPSGDSTRTDETGVGWLRGAPAGAQLLEARALGFGTTSREVSVGVGDTTRVTLSLGAVAVALDQIEVSGRSSAGVHPRMRGFEERRREANGHFVTLEQLDARKNSPVSNVLRLSPGANLIPRPSPCNGYAAAAGRRSGYSDYRCGDSVFLPACYLTVFVDGIVFWRPDSDVPPPDIDQFRTDDLEGVEIYVGVSQTPVQYQLGGPGGNCGAILLWHRVSAP
ncbi:MAG: carboxypeptidase regulatory-like domain-containing protein [Gemmatimonadales bacterium]